MQKKIERVVILGRKKEAGDALRWLLEHSIQVPLVVTQEGQPLAEVAKELNIPVVYDPEEIYRRIEQGDLLLKNIDLVVSYLFWGKIREPLIKLGNRGCINLHPAPLPDYKSRAGYNTAILDKRSVFGVSAHFIDSEAFDAGPIIKVREFPMDPENDTAWSLERRTQPELLALFKEVLTLFINGQDIPTKENKGGLYLTSKQLEALKEINLEKDTPEEIERKIRAFFFPPHHGAHIMINGKKYSLLDDPMLDRLSRMLKGLE
jgi:methionyl-tRNA formyltransferase